MTLVAWPCTVLLASAAALTLVRLVRGPTIIDRAIALEVLVVVALAAIVVEAATSGGATLLPVLVVVSLLGFVGSVAVARFVSGETDE